MSGLGQAPMGWMLAATMACVTATLLLRSGRQRTAINEALHELRRPLQALALSDSSASGPAMVESSTRLAAAALERLDREVNGGGDGPLRPEPVRCEAILRSAVGRWRARVSLDGGSLELRWRAGEAAVLGDPMALEQAVDNLIVNAIEHGGPRIVVEASRLSGRLLIGVDDSGRGDSGRSRHPRRGRSVSRISGGRRHGHGLAVVRRVAAEHRGRFVLQRGEGGAVAMLDLPLAADQLAVATSAAA